MKTPNKGMKLTTPPPTKPSHLDCGYRQLDVEEAVLDRQQDRRRWPS
jgi:hypothetical protein